MKSFVAFLLSFILIFSNVQIVLAEESVNSGGLQISEQYINPLYEDVISEKDLLASSEYSNVGLGEPVFTSDESEIVEQIRAAMVARAETFTLYYKSETALSQGFLKKWVNQAIAETGEPDEGDYLKLHYGGMSIPEGNGTGVYDDEGNIDYTLIVVATYYTTADQEAEVDQAVDTLIDTLGISKEMSNYEKVKTIYDYMCANIVYDYDNLNDTAYKLKYTAYAALINKTAVCQGYTSLLYRLLREVGVDVRSVLGAGNGKDHAWNLINIGDKYYYADATWDAVRNPYQFFLKGSTDFENHQANEEETFISAYNIPETGYVEHEHTWESTYTVDIPATYKEAGSKSIHCSGCTEKKDVTVIPKLEKQDPASPFTDVSTNSRFYKEIMWAYENGITAGKMATIFAPEDGCTRGQVVTFLWRAEGCPEPTTTTNPFTDVSARSSFYKAILWAYENGITTGKSATTFEPNAVVTREQFVTFLWRCEGNPAASASNPFVDVTAGRYSTPAILWAYENGITTGKTATTFQSGETVIRQHVVTFLYRAYN